MPIAGFLPLEQLEQAINGLRESARKSGKELSKVIVLAYPHMVDRTPQNTSWGQQQRLPMTGTIDQIAGDIERLKGIDGVEHIIFGYSFSPVVKDSKQIVELTKQLVRFP